MTRGRGASGVPLRLAVVLGRPGVTSIVEVGRFLGRWTTPSSRAEDEPVHAEGDRVVHTARPLARAALPGGADYAEY